MVARRKDLENWGQLVFPYQYDHGIVCILGPEFIHDVGAGFLTGPGHFVHQHKAFGLNPIIPLASSEYRYVSSRLNETVRIERTQRTCTINQCLLCMSATCHAPDKFLQVAVPGIGGRASPRWRSTTSRCRSTAITDHRDLCPIRRVDPSATLEHLLHRVNGIDVLQWISLQQHHICELSRLERTQLIVQPQDLHVAEGGHP